MLQQLRTVAKKIDYLEQTLENVLNLLGGVGLMGEIFELPSVSLFAMLELLNFGFIQEAIFGAFFF